MKLSPLQLPDTPNYIGELLMFECNLDCRMDEVILHFDKLTGGKVPHVNFI